MTLTKENIARYGLFAKGSVYVLIGILTALASFNLGGNEVGTKGALGFLSNQYLAKFLLLIMALGLFSYTFWRLHQSFFDSRNLGKDKYALFTRAGYFTGGVFYGFLGFVALKLLLGGNYDTQQEVLIRLLNSEYGKILAVAFGLILLGKAIFEVHFVVSKEFRRNVQSYKMKPKTKSLFLKFGIIGHVSRGVVFAIMAFLTIRTVFTFRNKEVSTVTDAFQFLDYQFGALILGTVAIGLLCFGLFMFVKAKYLNIQMK